MSGARLPLLPLPPPPPPPLQQPAASVPLSLAEALRPNAAVDRAAAALAASFASARQSVVDHLNMRAEQVHLGERLVTAHAELRGAFRPDAPTGSAVKAVGSLSFVGAGACIALVLLVACLCVISRGIRRLCRCILARRPPRGGYTGLRTVQHPTSSDSVRVCFELAGGLREDGELSLDSGVRSLKELRLRLLELADELLLDPEDDLGEWSLRYTDQNGALLPVSGSLTSTVGISELRRDAIELRVTAGRPLGVR